MKLGLQIQHLRKLKKMSLTSLAQESGVQIATLSRIENGKMTGTLESHLNISRALGVDITELYQDISKNDASDSSLTDVPEVIQANQKVSYEILAKQLSTKKMLPRLVKIDPAGAIEHQQLPMGSELFLFILEGTVTIQLKTQELRLMPGTSFYLNATQPHSILNPGTTTAKLLTVTTPVIL